MMPPASFVRPLPFLIALSVILTATAAAQTGLPHFAGIIDVPPGGALQAALDQAQPGDTIRLAAGATYTGWFTLPAKTGTGDILIRTTAPDSALPPVGPGSARHPSLRSRGSTPPRAARSSRRI